MKLTNIILGKVETKQDKSLKITLFTKDMEAMPVAELADLFTQVGKEIPEIEIDLAEEVGEKSPSKRLKDRLYVYYKKKHGNDVGFGTWYVNTLDTIGNQYLDKINDL